MTRPTGPPPSCSGVPVAPAPDRPRVRPLEAFPVRESGRPAYALRDPEGLVDGLVVVPPAVATLLSYFDGVRTRPEIAAAWAARTGEPLSDADLDGVIRELEE